MRKTSLRCVHELAKKDDRVLFIGSDLGPGVLDEMKKTIPARFLMEGVSEQHIIDLSTFVHERRFNVLTGRFQAVSASIMGPA